MTVQRALLIKEVDGTKCNVRKKYTEKTKQNKNKQNYGSRGVIYRIPMTTNIKEIETIPGVQKALRMKNKVQKLTTTILVFFTETIKPNEITLNSVVYPVNQSVQIQIQCGNCNKLGHFTTDCLNVKPIYGKCARKHETKDCQSSYKQCADCLGQHEAYNKGMPHDKNS